MQMEFLQSDEWRKFQEAVGRQTFCISSEDFFAGIVEHSLPIVGKYFYVPRGPIVSDQETVNKKQLGELIDLAREEKAGWIRFDPADEKMLKFIENAVGADLVSAREGQAQGLSLHKKYKIIKAPHDVQPKQIFVIDITGTEEEILAKMKSKTRYNIRLAEKKNIQVKIGKEYLEDFLRLTKVMAKRQGIAPHPDEYYRKMLGTIPEETIKLYAAEYDGKIIAANIMIFYGDMAIYLHGASDDEYRNVMAPYLLQWRAIRDAKQRGCTRYDFGGVKIENPKSQIPNPKQIPNSNEQKLKPIQDTEYKIPDTNWAGITRFKLGFSPETKPTEFPGSYDIIINSRKYWMYRFIQKVKSIIQ